jgi:hypothetical protein
MNADTLALAAAAAWAFIWSADFAGMLFGVSGTLLLATKGRLAGWGFVAFLASNIGWLVFAYEQGITKLFMQHAVFAVSSLLGVYVWLIRGRLAVRT